MIDPDALRIVLTPLQLATILNGGTLEQPSFTNRAWGAGRALLGAFEVVGGGALFLLPEPTFTTKVVAEP